MDWVTGKYAGTLCYFPETLPPGLPEGTEVTLRKHSSDHFELGLCVPNKTTSQSSWRWEMLSATRIDGAKKEAPAALVKLLHAEAGSRLLRIEDMQLEADAIMAFAATLE